MKVYYRSSFLSQILGAIILMFFCVLFMGIIGVIGVIFLGFLTFTGIAHLISKTSFVQNRIAARRAKRFQDRADLIDARRQKLIDIKRERDVTAKDIEDVLK